MSDQHDSPIKTPKQLIIVVVLAFLVPITVIVLLSQLFTGGEHGLQENQEAVLARIKAVGEVAMAGSAATAAPVNTAAAAPAAAAGGPPKDGKTVYESTCMVCHGAGVAGAPKFGDKAQWADRIKLGLPELYKVALAGKGAMPPKGGNAALSDGEVKAGVDYMVNASK